jgi:hypothetical protein
MSEQRTYSIEKLASILGFHKNYIKMMLRKMNIDTSLPVEEEDAISLAAKLNRVWTPSEKYYD